MDTEGIMTQSSLVSSNSCRSGSLQRVQVCQQIFDLLIGHYLAETFHFGATVLDDVGHAIVVCRQAAYRQILLLEYALQARPFLAARRIWFVAAVAIVVVELAPSGLLRVQAKFGVGLPALNIAGSEREQDRQQTLEKAEPQSQKEPRQFTIA